MMPGFRDSLSQDRAGVLCFGGARMVLLDIEAGFWGLRRQMEALVGPRLTDVVIQQAGVNGGASRAGHAGSGLPAGWWGRRPQTVLGALGALKR